MTLPNIFFFINFFVAQGLIFAFYKGGPKNHKAGGPGLKTNFEKKILNSYYDDQTPTKNIAHSFRFRIV